jgi:hypothetical protein
MIQLDMVYHNHEAAPYNFEAIVIGSANVSYNDYTYQYPSGYATISAFFGHTFTWGGITSVTDADTGEEITDWTLTSDSGFDWAHAADAPEPSTGWSALIGMSLVLPYIQRRRKRFCPSEALVKSA